MYQIKKYSVISKTFTFATLSSSDLIDALVSKGYNPEEVLIEVDQSIPEDFGYDEVKIHLDEIIKHGLIENGKRYIADRTTASLARQATLVYMEEHCRAAMEAYSMCGLRLEILKERFIAINKLFVYKGLQMTVSRPFSQVFGVKLDISRICIFDDCEISFTLPVKMVRGDEFVNEERNIDLKVTDGQIIIRSELIEHETNAFILRADFMKGLAVGASFEWFYEHDVTEVIDHWGNCRKIEDIDAFVPMSAFKMGAYYDSWEQYVSAFQNEGKEVRVCLMQHHPKWASLSYQVLQTMVGANVDDLNSVADETVDILNGFSKPENAAKLPGGFLSQACKLYPELMAEPYTEETMKESYRKRRGEAKGGRVFKAGQFRFLATDPVAIFQHIAGMEPVGMIRANTVVSNQFKCGEAALVRYPHLNVNFANVQLVHNPDPRYYTGTTIFVSAHDTNALLLRADYDGDKAFIINDPKLLAVIHKSQAVWAERQVDWDAPGATKVHYSARAVYEYCRSLTGGARVGVHSNNATRTWARIWDHLQRETSVTDNMKNAIAWLEMAANIDIDAAKNSGANLREPNAVYLEHGEIVSNEEGRSVKINDPLPAALAYARGEDAVCAAEHRKLARILDQYAVYERYGRSRGSNPLDACVRNEDELGVYYTLPNGKFRCIRFDESGQNRHKLILRALPSSGDYQTESGLINEWMRIVDRRTPKTLTVEGSDAWCFSVSPMLIDSAPCSRIPGLFQQGYRQHGTNVYENEGLWQTLAFAHRDDLERLAKEDASPAVYADYKEFRRAEVIRQITEFAAKAGSTIEHAYNSICVLTFGKTQKSSIDADGYFYVLKRFFWDIFGEMAVNALKKNLHKDDPEEDDIDFDIREDLEAIDE